MNPQRKGPCHNRDRTFRSCRRRDRVDRAAFAREMDADGDGICTLVEIRSDFRNRTGDDPALLDPNGAADAEELVAIEGGALPTME